MKKPLPLVIKVPAKLKMLFITLFLCFATTTSNAQVLISLIFGEKLNSPDVEFGLDGGVSLSHMSHLDSKKWFSALNLGFYFDLKVKKQWYLYTGVLVRSTTGTRGLSDQDLNTIGATIHSLDGVYSQAVRYYVVPILAKYRFKNNFYVELGPQLGLRHKAYVQFEADYENNTLLNKEKNGDALKRIDAGLRAGVGYKIKKGTGLTLGIIYYIGFIDVYKDVSGPKNQSLMFKINIPIGAAKKKKA